MRCILVFDVGTGGIHVNLVDVNGKFAGSAYEEIRYGYLDDCNGLDWDPPASWEKGLAAASAALAESGVGREDVAAVAVTSQRHGMAFTDEDGTVLLGTPNLDARSRSQVEALSREFCEKVYDLTARWPDVYFPALRLRWLKDNRPGDYRKVTRALMVNEYFIYRLTGRMCSEWTNAAETMLFDVGRLAWSDDMRAIFGFDNVIPNDLIAPGDAAGALRPEIAERLGLPELPVVAAVSDTQAAALGSGMVRVGDVVAVNGSTTPILMLENHFLKDPGRRIWTDPYLKDLWILESNCLQSGMVHRRLMDHLVDLIRMLPGQDGFTRGELYSLLEKLEGSTSGVVSYFGSRRFHVSRTESRRLHITFPNEETNIFAAILPSYMENLAFAVAANLEQLEEISGRTAPAVCLTGGGSKSRHFRRLVPALLPDRRVMVTKDLETTSRGAALQAWVAIGEFDGVVEAVEEMAKDGWYEELRPEAIPGIDERYKMWKELFG